MEFVLQEAEFQTDVDGRYQVAIPWKDDEPTLRRTTFRLLNEISKRRTPSYLIRLGFKHHLLFAPKSYFKKCGPLGWTGTTYSWET